MLFQSEGDAASCSCLSPGRHVGISGVRLVPPNTPAMMLNQRETLSNTSLQICRRSRAFHSFQTNTEALIFKDKKLFP